MTFRFYQQKPISFKRCNCLVVGGQKITNICCPRHGAAAMKKSREAYLKRLVSQVSGEEL